MPHFFFAIYNFIGISYHEVFWGEGVSLQKNSLSNDANDMFDNIHIEAQSGAPEKYTETGSVYFRTSELEKLHSWSQKLHTNFAPHTLPYAVLLNSKDSVEEEFQEMGLDGKYLFDEQPTIHLLYENLNGYARAVFWHEYGHHLWFSLNIELKPEWKEIKNQITLTASYQEALDLDTFIGKQYLTLPKELWARLFSQFLLLQLHDMEAWRLLAGIPEGFWTLTDVSQLTPLIETLLSKLNFTEIAKH